MAVIEDLTGEFSKLPGIGRKTALRLTYFLLKRPPEEIRRLARALESVAERVKPCTRCGNLTEETPCGICANPRRDASTICVVEEPGDIGAIERTGQFRGVYHVLGGRLSPLEGIGPDELTIALLLRRVAGSRSAGDDTHGETFAIREIIVATNPSVEGEATALYLDKLIRPMGVRVTRLARGLPVGGDLEYADGVTIAEALAGRRDIE
jgi:recombination protein RecR